MFCIHCGQELEEGGRFCPKCGASAEPNVYRDPAAGRRPQQTQMAYGPGDTAMKKGVSPAVAVMVIAAVLVCVAGMVFGVYWNFFRDSYKTPIKNMVKVVEEQDMNAALELVPEQYLDVLQTMTGMGPDEVAGLIERGLIGGVGGHIGNVKVDYKIVDARNLTDSELQDLENSYFGYLRGIEDGKEVKFTYETYTDGELWDAGEESITVIRVDGKWYLNPGDL